MLRRIRAVPGDVRLVALNQRGQLLKPLSAIGEHPTLGCDIGCGPRLNCGYAVILKMIKARSKRTI